MRRLTTPENQVKKDIVQLLTLLKIPPFRLNSGGVAAEYKGKKRFIRMSFRGCPDLFALLPNGMSLWIEVKSKTGKMRPDQIIFQEICKSRNVPHLVARSSEDVERWLKEYGILG